MPFTEAWIESQPDGAIVTVSELDNWIRKTKVAIRERLEETLFLPGTFATGPVINPAIGGGGLALPAIIEGAVAADKIVYIHNTSLTGFGLRVQNDGPVTNYALKVSNAAGVSMVTMYGHPTIHIGPEGSAQALAVLGNGTTNSMLSLEAITAVDGQAGIIMKALSFGIVSMLYQTGGDGGMRLAWNYKEPYDVNGSYANPNYRQIQFSFETDGAVGINYGKARVTAPGAYDGLGGKSLKIFGGGYQTGVGPYDARGPNTSIVVGQVGRGLEFGLSDVDPNDYLMKFRIQGGGGANPIQMYVAGAIRTIQSFNDGLGHNVLYW